MTMVSPKLNYPPRHIEYYLGKAPRAKKVPSELMKFHPPHLAALAHRRAPDILRWALHPEFALR